MNDNDNPRSLWRPTRSLIRHTVWNVAEWLEAHDNGHPYEIFPDSPTQEHLNADEKFGYRLTVERIPQHPDPFAIDDQQLARIKRALVVLDDHLAAASLHHPRRELQAFLAAYDIPWNNPA